MEFIRFEAENAQLKTALADASSRPTVDSPALADLRDRVDELESSLTLKTQEVDEADDRVRDQYKLNAKLQKKVDKLQRQLTALETADNTRANAKLTKAEEVALESRQPLRPVIAPNIFEVSAGTKRVRQDSVDEKPPAVEAIMLMDPPVKPAKIGFGTRKIATGDVENRPNLFALPGQDGGAAPAAFKIFPRAQ